ncbi:uncharacterized protein IAS62_006413 [Cryptococcus decagattii]|uniref:Uncharacterized protein n=1 Tax=Cryptococcus decagattii TaxID=1859122 RepID=A0ABZ2B2V8_9TREE
MFMHYHPTLAPSGPAPPEPPLFLAKPIPALPHRTINSKLRPNLIIKLGTAGSKSSIICQATLKRNSKHHRPHSQFMRQPSLSVIPEQSEESIPSMPALSRTSSSSRLLPSLELVTPVSNILSSLFKKDEEKKGKLQAWWSWVGWSALEVKRLNKKGMRITIEDLPDVGPAVTATSSTETPSPGPDLSDQSKADHFFSGLDCEKAPDGDSDSDSETESSRWSGIIPRAVFYDKTWIAGSSLSQTDDGVCEQEKSLLDDVPQETKKERNERLKNWMEKKSDLIVGGSHEYFIKSVHLPSHYTTSVNTTTASRSFTAETRTGFLKWALRRATNMLDPEALGDS